MKNRKAITKKLRFEIFKRDDFKCQYCGSTPPSVVLEIDHIAPVSKGGDNDIDNLITSCFDCNRGKTNVLLTNIPETIAFKSEILSEKICQIKAYEKLIKSRKKIEENQINELESIFQLYFKYSFSGVFKESIRIFIQNLPIDIVDESMRIACLKPLDAEQTLKYFCGICWRHIREKNDAK